ncbi:MAG TPA: hemolysin III family protein [Pseudomonadota bacterium]|jgi:hemolysin III|nr:hemolysin III family protein [Pseudomonadota bacterium]HND09919.1 hemolysin III family protein [Pseudomonadota bacterium]HNF99059.1 hemolysin III family protein [Pseudomonadota bacterium]HNK43292.1 hemolysin III family protein [Pseudomonadota bacterium]HNN52621.1 hemolysin III family protein [Pseudomonadota bacterium]
MSRPRPQKTSAIEATIEHLAAAIPLEKPLLRGVSHQAAFFAAFPLAYWLVSLAQTDEARTCALVYGIALIALFGVSALYHRKHWQPGPRAFLKRLDHSNIFLFIAGNYTPITILGVGGSFGKLLCSVLWIGAAAGVLQTVFWPSAPRVLHVGIYVVLGWIGGLGLPGEWRHLGPQVVALHVGGGILYTLGALTYAKKTPNPFPRVFGYHEIFHLLVIIACGALFEVVRKCLLLPA